MKLKTHNKRVSRNEVAIVMNGDIRISGSDLFLDSTTVKFLSELVDLKDLSVTVISASDRDLTFYDKKMPEEVKTRLFGVMPEKKMFKLLYYLRIFFSALFRKMPDHIYLFFPGNFSLAFLAAVFLRRKNYSLYLRGQVLYSNSVLRWFSGKVLRNADFIIATGQATAKYASKYNLNVEEVVPMMNVSKKDLMKRESYNLSSPVKLLFLSRVEKDKGIWECINAVKKLIENGCDIVFEIAGGGTPEMIERISNETLSIKDKVKIHGQITEKKTVSELFKKADIYLFPSHHEGFPRVLYEAMTFSTPVVTTDIPGVTGLMRDDFNCVMVPPKNTEKLTEAVMRLIQDGELRKNIGDNSYFIMGSLFEKINGNSHAKQLCCAIKNVQNNGK